MRQRSGIHPGKWWFLHRLRCCTHFLFGFCSYHDFEPYRSIGWLLAEIGYRTSRRSAREVVCLPESSPVFWGQWLRRFAASNAAPNALWYWVMSVHFACRRVLRVWDQHRSSDWMGSLLRCQTPQRSQKVERCTSDSRIFAAVSCSKMRSGISYHPLQLGSRMAQWASTWKYSSLARWYSLSWGLRQSLKFQSFDKEHSLTLPLCISHCSIGKRSPYSSGHCLGLLLSHQLHCNKGQI